MELYTGFFINEAVGNNSFSYIERKNRQIYVPSLIEGSLKDVKTGETIAFSEVDEDIEINAKGLKNFVKFKHRECDVYVFDNHNHAFYFWTKALKEGKINKGLKLVHIDQHKDMRVPDSYITGIDDLKQVFNYVNNVLNVGNFIKPALDIGLFKAVFIMDSTSSLSEKIEEEIVLDIDLDIFSRDMDYINYDVKLKVIKSLIKKAKLITIATSPFFINQDEAIRVLKDIFEGDHNE